ncbi:MAG: hypothetical protein IT371_23025 [Deltaproteobacteria bacterium]|nr:hypothetical protein [Deltaproteobacteria bacterium]
MYRIGILVVSGILSLACAQAPDEPPAPKAGTGGSPGVSNAAPARPVGLLPRSGRRGGTNVDTSGLFGFSWTPTSGTLAAITPVIEARAAYVDEAGARVAAEVVFEDVSKTEPGTEPYFRLRAKTPLEPDRWHWLVLEQDAELRVVGAEHGGAWSVHFFTGSFPHLVAARTSGEKDPLLMYLDFSEPLTVTAGDAARLVTQRGVAAGSCVLRGIECLGQRESVVTEGVQLRLRAPLDPATAAFEVPGATDGSGRTVLEGAAAAGVLLTGGALVVAPPADAWRACADGAGQCWEETRDVPAGSR